MFAFNRISAIFGGVLCVSCSCVDALMCFCVAYLREGFGIPASSGRIKPLSTGADCPPVFLYFCSL